MSMDYLAGTDRRGGPGDAGDRDARLLLQPFRTTDAADVYRYAQDWGGAVAAGLPTKAWRRAVRSSARCSPHQTSFYGAQGDERLIGSGVGFVGSHPAGSTAQMTSWACPPRQYWGRGLMPEAAQVLRYGFERLHRVWCPTTPGTGAAPPSSASAASATSFPAPRR